MLKTILIILALAAAAPFAPARAQQAHVYQLGTKSVAIPPPAGFVEAMSQFEHVANLMKTTEDPGNDVLAAHLPAEMADQVRRGERTQMTFYTKVSVMKILRARDTTEADFASTVAHFEKTGQQVLDINGPVMKSAVKNLREGLNNAVGTEVPLELRQPQHLGSFQKTKDVYSVMLLMTLKVPEGEWPVLVGASFVRVRGRLLFVYAYRKFNSEKDAEVLRDFTRQWVTEIVAANR